MNIARILPLLVFTAPSIASDEISVGTGFFYNSAGHLFTNRHVIANCAPGRIRVRTSDKTIHSARILAVDSRVDIAALSIDHEVGAFASFRLSPGTKSISIPTETEDAFSAGFSAPAKSSFKLQYKWGQIQPWNDPSKFPYVNRMRMDAYSGASGSPVLDYAGLLIGIVFAGSVKPVDDYDKLKSVGYGDKWIYIHNNNALLLFANEYRLQYNAWGKRPANPPLTRGRSWRRRDQMLARAGDQRCGSNSPIRLFLCVGSRVSTSFR